MSGTTDNKNKCPGGEIGRHKGLKIPRTKHPCRFDPGPGHHLRRCAGIFFCFYPPQIPIPLFNLNLNHHTFPYLFTSLPNYHHCKCSLCLCLRLKAQCLLPLAYILNNSKSTRFAAPCKSQVHDYSKRPSSNRTLQLVITAKSLQLTAKALNTAKTKLTAKAYSRSPG